MSVMSVCREWRNISLDLFLHSFIGKFVHLDAEIDEDEETDAANSGVDGAAKSEGVVNAMSHDGHQQNAGTNLGRPIGEVVQ